MLFLTKKLMEENLRNYLIDWLNYGSFSNDPLKELEKYDIRVSTDERYPNLFNLKYGSIMSDKTLPLVRACRGAVVERCPTSGQFRLVAYAFDRFFNIGEPGCHELNWGTTKVMNKEDGSLCKVFNYRDEWIISTSGTVAGGSEVGSTGRTFAELFWNVFNHVGYSLGQLDEEKCYIFELCHRDNKIVVDYPEPKLPLLAVRDRVRNFEELPLEEFARDNGFSIPESYAISNPQDIANFVNSRDGKYEGVVLFDGVGRAKSKSDIYCQLHRVKGNGTPDFAELFLNDDLEEFLLHFPEFSPKFNTLLSIIDDMGATVESTLAKYNHMDQKEFAINVLKEAPKVSAACFSIRSGKHPSFAAWVEALTPQQLNRLLS